MTEHYFSQKPQTKSSPKKWNYQLRGIDYTFVSDDGVFSKNEVDYGTRLLIERFESPEIEGGFLDLGSGYGPIGISLADCYRERHIVMAEINERALRLAEQNVAHNNIPNTELVQSDRFSNLAGRTFAAIVTNPPIRAGKKVVHQMFEESKDALLKEGSLWAVIQKKQGAPSAIQKLKDLFGDVEVVARSKGYFILKATND